jgi:hypothetical protein
MPVIGCRQEEHGVALDLAERPADDTDQMIMASETDRRFRKMIAGKQRVVDRRRRMGGGCLRRRCLQPCRQQPDDSHRRLGKQRIGGELVIAFEGRLLDIDAKRLQRIGKAGIASAEDLRKKAERALRRLQRLPGLVMAFFSDPHIQYARAV